MKPYFTAILFLTLTATISRGETPPSAKDLLSASDRSRGAAASLKGVAWVAQITSTENDDKSDATYIIKAKGDDALAEVTAPPRQKGEKTLFNDRTLWFVKPGLKKPVSISPRQKLQGQASNGDIASTRYARDYDGVVAGEEVVNGINTWKLELTAKSKNVTYDKIKYWIAKKDGLAVKAAFLTIAGDLFKTATFKYDNSITVGSDKLPFVSEMTISDANNPKNQTLIKYKTPHEDALAVTIFNVNNLVR